MPNFSLTIFNSINLTTPNITYYMMHEHVGMNLNCGLDPVTYWPKGVGMQMGLVQNETMVDPDPNSVPSRNWLDGSDFEKSKYIKGFEISSDYSFGYGFE